MPMYPFKCFNCNHEFDVAARMSERSSLTPKCQKCDTILSYKNRLFVGINFTNEKVEDTTYCPALGCLVKGQKHREQIAKARGLEPLGNESIDSVNKFFDNKQKEIEKKHKQELEHSIMSAMQ